MSSRPSFADPEVALRGVLLSSLDFGLDGRLRTDVHRAPKHAALSRVSARELRTPDIRECCLCSWAAKSP